MAPKKQAHPEQKLQNSAESAGSLSSRYDAMVRSGAIHDDPAQRAVIAKLQHLHDRLRKKARRTAAKGVLATLFKATPKPERGLYMWGNVGRGKSMLMNLFFEQPLTLGKRRVHFHAFMQEVHGRIHQLRQQGAGDPVAMLAREIAGHSPLLCFDELQATDVADATLLYRLFEGMFAAGVTIVSTSNRPPATLYTGGVQRERFQKFIALLEGQMDICPLSSEADYRTIQRKSLKRVYFYPLGAQSEEFLNDVLKKLGNPEAEVDTFSIQGRTLNFTRYDDSIGRFSFASLCEAALGPADYLAIARRLSTVILTDIPQLSPEKRNEAKRFVTLIDALYEHKVELICTAATSPDALYTQGDGSFEFARNVSRLKEMQSDNYLQESR
jgi:cell division protein ZapE